MGRKRFEQKFGDEFLASIPACPGVYLWRDSEGALLYVGKAVHLRRRISQYRNATRLKRDRKMRDIVKRAATLEWETCETDLDACLREIRLIQEHRPPVNVAGAFSARYPFLGIAFDAKSVRLLFTASPENQGEFRLFGAFRSRQTVLEAFFALVRLLRFVGHAKPKPLGRRGEYHFVFRQLPEESGARWTKFFLGEEREPLEDLALRLLSNAGARAKAQDVQDDIDAVRRFWDEEAVPLANAIRGTGYAAYPVPQTERDPLFLRFRAGAPSGTLPP